MYETDTVSVVIPTLNRRTTLQQTLDALSKQTYRGNTEIVIVDGGSTDGTESVIFEKNKSNNIKFIFNPRGPASGRNTGIKNAKGDIILFTDDDCVPETDWIQKHIEWYARDPTLVGVSGALIPRFPTTIDTMEFFDNHKIYIDKEIQYNYPVVGGNNCSYKRSVLEKLGGFDESFEQDDGKVLGGEDSDLAERAAQYGRTVLDPSIVVYHLKKSTLSKRKLNDWYRWGIGAYIYNSKRNKTQLYQFGIPLYTLARTWMFYHKLNGQNIILKTKLASTYFVRQFVMDIGYLSKAITVNKR